jgi:hypothetical protein
MNASSARILARRRPSTVRLAALQGLALGEDLFGRVRSGE